MLDDYFYYVAWGDPTNCSKYYSCSVDGFVTVRSCGVGQVFDPSKGQCTITGKCQGPCPTTTQSRTPTTQSTTPTIQSSTSSPCSSNSIDCSQYPKNYVLPDLADCSSYYTCDGPLIDSTPSHASCGKDKLFDSVTKNCKNFNANVVCATCNNSSTNQPKTGITSSTQNITSFSSTAKTDLISSTQTDLEQSSTTKQSSALVSSTSTNAKAVYYSPTQTSVTTSASQPLTSQPLTSQPLTSQPLMSQLLTTQAFITKPFTQPSTQSLVDLDSSTNSEKPISTSQVIGSVKPTMQDNDNSTVLSSIPKSITQSLRVTNSFSAPITTTITAAKTNSDSTTSQQPTAAETTTSSIKSERSQSTLALNVSNATSETVLSTETTIKGTVSGNKETTSKIELTSTSSTTTLSPTVPSTSQAPNSSKTMTSTIGISTIYTEISKLTCIMK